MRKLLVLAALAVCAHAQYVTVSASKLRDASGSPANGKITFSPHNAVKLTGQGQVTLRSVVATVTNGVFSATLADTTKTTPSSCYNVTVTDSLNRVWLGDPSPNVQSGYQCVTTTTDWCTSGSCNFDNYTPDYGSSITVGGSSGSGGTATSNVLYTVNKLPAASGTSGQIAWVGDAANSTDCTQGSGSFLVACVSNGSAWAARSTGALPYTQVFANQTNITLTHNLNSSNVITACYDPSNQLIEPGAITISDANNVAIQFASPATGRCVVNAGAGGTGSSGLSGSNYNYPFNAATSLVITHNLNTRNVLVMCYDGSDNFLIPGLLTVTDQNRVTVGFTAAETGRCVVNTGGGFGGLTSGSGTGTATVTEYVDMSTKGVVGDGTTDARAAILAQLATNTSNSGGTNHRLYFPPGTYAISDTITIPTKTEIYGNGVGDPFAGGTTFQPTAGFPSGHPLFKFGTTSSDLTQRSSLHDMNIACQSLSGLGVYKFNAQEQTSIHHIVFFGCGDTAIRIVGSNSCGAVGGCTGYSEHDGPDHDLEVYPDHWGTTTTTCFDIRDDQNYHGLENVTCAMGSYITKPTFGGKFACSGCSAHGLHFENSTHGMTIGASATQGISGAVLYNIDGTTGVTGNIVEIESNSTNQPYDLHVWGVNGGAMPIKNLAYPLYGDSHTYMEIGQQFNGRATITVGDYGAAWNIFNPLNLWTGVNSQIAGHLWCNKYDGGGFPNFCIDADASGNLILGGNASGAKDVIFDDPFASISLAQQATTENGLNLQGAIGNSSNAAQSMVANNLRYNGSTGKYILPGNTSGEADGYESVNPGGTNPIRAIGGFGIFAQVGLTEGGTGYTQTQHNTWFDALFPTSGGLMLFGESKGRPACNATTRETIWFNYDFPNVNDTIAYCGYQGGVLAWNVLGQGGGGGTSNATQIQSVNVANTAPSDKAVLQYQSGATQWQPTVLPSIAASGCGATVTGTTSLTINSIRHPDSTQPTTIPAADACGSPLWYTTVTTIALPQPGLGGNFLDGNWFVVYNHNSVSITITPSSSTIGVNGAAGTSSYSLAAGHAISIFVSGTNYVAEDR